MKALVPFVISSFIFFVLTPYSLTGQCSKADIIQANDDYLAGRFETAINNLSRCNILKDNLYDKSLLKNRVEGLSVLAKAYIAMDSVATAKRILEKIIIEEPTFVPQIGDPYFFKELYKTIKKDKEAQTVVSASKTGEDIYETPATVILITEEQIKNRGYMDLEELLHDLPGFDIARSNGILYSNFYQRGYRTYGNDRFLVLVDGVEENSIIDGVVYLSRQYPLSNIKSVEVIYGPVSTIYGPNSFLGTISITTKKPGELLEEDDNIGISFETGYGSWNTRYIDGTIAASFPKQDIDISFTYRRFHSDEPNLGELDPLHSFQPLQLSDLVPSTDTSSDGLLVREWYEDRFTIQDSSKARAFFEKYGQDSDLTHLFDTVTYLGQFNIIPTEAALEEGLRIDNAADSSFNNQGYQDFTQINMLSFRARIKKIYLGVYSWVNEEGNGVWFAKYDFANDQKWSPQKLGAFIKYEEQFSKKLSFISFTRYKRDRLDENTYINFFSGYRNALGLEDLILQRSPNYIKLYFSAYSSQIRAENTLIFRKDKYTQAIVGIENRLSSIQDDFYIGTFSHAESDPNYNVRHFTTSNLGAYMQVSRRFGEYVSALKNIQLTAGVRLDNQKVFRKSNTEPVRSVRIVGLYTMPENAIFKLIYSSAFKTPIFREAYSTFSGVRDVINPYLPAERVQNYELSVRKFLKKDGQSNIHLTGFYSDYSKAAELIQHSGDTVVLGRLNARQVVGIGERRIFGLEGTIDYHWSNEKGDNFYFWGNYSYVVPRLRTNDGSSSKMDTSFVTISDMSPHKFNLGVNYRKKRLNTSLRLNFLSRPITSGEDSTTTVNNPFSDVSDVFEATAIIHGSVSYHFNNHFSLQLVVNNILNSRYFHPSMREANGTSGSARLPQNPRGIHVKLRYNLSTNSKNIGER